MRFLYDLIFICFSFAYLPFFLMRLKQAESKKRLLAERCGFLSGAIQPDTRAVRLWIHAVSVGEVLTIRVLIDELKKKIPQAAVFVSVVTPTGFSVAKKQLAPDMVIFYLPFDLSWITDRVMARIAPRALVLVETELWPNLIAAADKKKVPVCIVNGRLSPRSFKRYHAFRHVLKPMIDKIACVTVQNECYRERFVALGFSAGRVTVTGTMKFDVLAGRNEPLTSALRQAWSERCGFPQGAFIFMAASTHAPEEQYCLAAYRALREKNPAARLVIAPRHINRTPAIIDDIEKNTLRWRCADEAAVAGKQSVPQEADVFVLNTIGELAAWYRFCDLVFVGGSLIPHGGQNPLEAAVCGCPIITGNAYHNFPDIYDVLRERGGVVVVDSPEQLRTTVGLLSGDAGKRRAMGEIAAAFIAERCGASAKNAARIQALLSEDTTVL